MLSKFATVVLFLLVGLPAHSQGPTGFGVYHCTDILLDRGNRITAQNWAVGYLSGMNVVWARYAPENIPKDPLGKIKDPNAIYQWLDSYCKNNTQATLAPALQIYFVELAGLKK